MRELRRGAVILGLVAVGVMAGCGGSDTSQGDCNLTPEVNQPSGAPSSCRLAPSSQVTVKVHWCSCGPSTTCDVSFNSQAGVYQLEPKVTSCDASCPANPTSCPFESVPCTFTTQASGDYNLYVISGQSFVNVPLTVGGGATTCGS